VSHEIEPLSLLPRQERYLLVEVMSLPSVTIPAAETDSLLCILPAMVNLLPCESIALFGTMLDLSSNGCLGEELATSRVPDTLHICL
jgi:hypothetical protein